jgi:hypothetical protein
MEQLAAEDTLRQQLNETGHPYRTLHANNLVGALQVLSDRTTSTLSIQPHHQRQRWLLQGCEKCSDPVCEHRLFLDLIERRTAPNGSH